MSMRETMEARLRETFSPQQLEVIDESERHRGHSGWREGGETHFRVRIVAEAFTGMNRLARHRAVNACLDAELKGGVHALAIEARSPDETDPRTVKVSGP